MQQSSSLANLLGRRIRPSCGVPTSNQQLRSTFEDSFGFPTTVSYLNAKASLELQVLSKVSEFAAAHDGPDDLLVVYYAGCVDVGKYCFKHELNDWKSRDEIVWEESEKVLRMTVSHVLWIFDGSFLHHLIQIVSH